MSNGSDLAKHRMRVTVSESDGLAAEPICVGHNPDSCPVRESFFWDPPASMEDYRGAEKVLADFPIVVTEISEDGWYWEEER